MYNPIKIIVNVNKNWAIGRKGVLLTHIPEDMHFFKEKTEGGIVIMGRKTLFSFPHKKPLKARINIVLTRNVSLINAESINESDIYYDLSTGIDFKDTSSLDGIIQEICQVLKDNTLFLSRKNLKDLKTVLVTMGSHDDVLRLCKKIDEAYQRDLRIFVIGGESVYRGFLDDCDECLVTANDCDLKGDSFFPDLSLCPNWKMKNKGNLREYKGIQFSFDTWEKSSVDNPD